MKDVDRPRKCPACKGSLARVFTEVNPIVRGNPRTFGQASEENEKRLGKEQVQLMREEMAKPRKKKFAGKLPEGAKLVDTSDAATPPWRDGSMGGLKPMDKPLNLKKVKDVKKYIRTGETK